jgi:hypothetical protein
VRKALNGVRQHRDHIFVSVFLIPGNQSVRQHTQAKLKAYEFLALLNAIRMRVLAVGNLYISFIFSNRREMNISSNQRFVSF